MSDYTSQNTMLRESLKIIFEAGYTEASLRVTCDRHGVSWAIDAKRPQAIEEAKE